MVIRCDSEPATLSFKIGVSKLLQEKYGQEVLSEDAYTGTTSSASNGLAEHAVNEVKAKTRGLKAAAEAWLGIKIERNHAALTWLVLWAAMAINIGRRGPDGRTAWELRYGKTFNRKVCRFGEHVMFLKVAAEKGLKDRFFHGCWLGLALTSDNVNVSDEQGNVMIARSFRRFAEPLCRGVGLFNRIKDSIA